MALRLVSCIVFVASCGAPPEEFAARSASVSTASAASPVVGPTVEPGAASASQPDPPAAATATARTGPHSWDGASPDVRDWLEPRADWGRSLLRGDDELRVPAPSDATIEREGPGHAGWMRLTTSLGRSSIKVRRTATNFDPTAVFDAFPACGSMANMRARVGAARVVFDESWDEPAIAGSSGGAAAKLELLVISDARGFGYYAIVELEDYLDKVNQESTLTACCGPGTPDEASSLRARVPETAAREHVAICLGARTPAH